MNKSLRGRLSMAAISMVAAASFDASAANILWLSDNNGEASGFTTSLPTVNESGWYSLLQNAGHTVTHYNPPNAGAVSLADVAQMNTFDLVVFGRSLGSTAFNAANTGDEMNTQVTAPMLSINAYLTRNSRMGWFTGGDDVPDGVPTGITQISSDPQANYIFGAPGSGNYDEAIDRNTSHTYLPLAGAGVAYANATFQPLGRTTNVTATIIAYWEAGTAVRGGADILAGDRWYFAAGSRESATGGSVATAGIENLSPYGEALFLRTVDQALGVPEPSTFALLGLGAVVFAFGFRRRK